MTIKTLITFGSQMIYNFNHISESRKIDTLIARLPPKLLERNWTRSGLTAFPRYSRISKIATVLLRTLRMGEDESFSAFKLKVPGLEAALRYDFRTVPDKRIIELRLGHVTPKLVERVQARTKDLQDLKTVKGLFGFIERMEAADQKVAWGRQLSAAPVIQSTASTFDYAYQAKNFRAELECFQISLRGFFRHNRSMQHEIDMLLTSIPRHILFELRRDTRNFKDIETCNDVFKHLSRPGDMCSNGPPGSEDEEPVDRRRRE
ncbi:hypothetical protein IWZ03DRAFT_363651 [Phyllosticta citriasiana]|uniref:Uncharacterized protein n=1 Tax=Phyllosticta citriasiana TaxID=595635 RepID=A0ABR1KB52_9PEZI